MEMILEPFRSTAYASVEERNQVYRKEIVEVLQIEFALVKEEDVTLLPLRLRPCYDRILVANPEKHPMSIAYAVSVHDCTQSKVMRLSNRNVFGVSMKVVTAMHSLQ